jgi:hypothetical protein
MSQDRPRCGAKLTSRPGTCRSYPMRGQRRCRKHGGASPRARNAAALRLAEQAAASTLAQMNIIPIDDPLEALKDLAAEARSFQAYARRRLAELGDNLTGKDRHDAEYARAMVVIYERAVDRLGRLLATWVRLEMDERLVQVTERRAEMILLVLTGTLRQLGHDPDEGHVRTALAAQLRAVS